MDSPEREIYRDPDVVRADDRVNEVVHTDTARKMLSIFRQMEENACKKELPNGPKPLKRFTPPPEDKYAKATASDSEEDEDEDGEESEGEDSGEERDPNYVRASDKVSMARTLSLIVRRDNKRCRLLTSSQATRRDSSSRRYEYAQWKLPGGLLKWADGDTDMQMIRHLSLRNILGQCEITIENHP